MARTRHRAIVVATIVGALAWLPRATPEPMSFEQALVAMKARNEALMAAQDNVRQREAEQAAAKGLHYPTIDLEARQIGMDKPITIGIDPIPVRLKVQDTGFTEGNVTVKVPLYTGGRIDAANRAAEARKSEAGAEARTTESQLVTELAQRYFGLCLAQRASDVQKLKVDTMEQHGYRATRLMEEGIIARVEFLNANVALENAKQELQAAEHDVAIVAEGLANIVVSEGPIEPTTPLFVLREVETREMFLGYVDEGHPIIEMLASKRDLAAQGIRVEQGAGKPTLYLFGTHELFPNDLTMLDPEWAVGIGLQYTLFDGFQTRNKTEAARAVEQKVIHMQQKVRRDLKSLVLKRYEEMSKARDQYDALNASLELAHENLRVRSRAFEEGLATSVEVVDATLSLARVQLGRHKAAYDLDLALFQLLEACGRSVRCLEYVAGGDAVENESGTLSSPEEAAPLCSVEPQKR